MKRSLERMHANLDNTKSINSINSITLTEKNSEIRKLENLLMNNQTLIREASERKEYYKNRCTQQRAELERTLLLSSEYG